MFFLSCFATLISFVVSDKRVCVTGTNGVGLNLHSSPCTTASVIDTALPGESFVLSSNISTTACGYDWYYLNNKYYAVTNYLQLCGGIGNEWNVFGIGLVTEGDTNQNKLVSDFAGDKGWILLIFAGIDSTTTSAQPSWISSLNNIWLTTNLNVIIRLNPPWGSSYYRDESDDTQHINYTTLSKAFTSVIKQLPLNPDGKTNLYLQIDNEPDLCYEWWCKTAQSQPISYTQMAKEYAYFYSYVSDAIHALPNGNRYKISTAGISPGGAIQCGCCGAANCNGDKGGITGLQYMQAMINYIPNVFHKIDFLASHSYPANGIGYGFNVGYPSCLPGLRYYEKELNMLNRSVQVLITETGWCTHPPNGSNEPECSEQDKAIWSMDAYNGVWLNDSRIMGVTPFMLQDSYWGDQIGFEYVLTNGQKVDVYTETNKLRCNLGFTGGSC
eukprot:195169_1